jgi:hypothetical protein
MHQRLFRGGCHGLHQPGSGIDAWGAARAPPVCIFLVKRPSPAARPGLPRVSERQAPGRGRPGPSSDESPAIERLVQRPGKRTGEAGPWRAARIAAQGCALDGNSVGAKIAGIRRPAGVRTALWAPRRARLALKDERLHLPECKVAVVAGGGKEFVQTTASLAGKLEPNEPGCRTGLRLPWKRWYSFGTDVGGVSPTRPQRGLGRVCC